MKFVFGHTTIRNGLNTVFFKFCKCNGLTFKYCFQTYMIFIKLEHNGKNLILQRLDGDLGKAGYKF